MKNDFPEWMCWLSEVERQLPDIYGTNTEFDRLFRAIENNLSKKDKNLLTCFEEYLRLYTNLHFRRRLKHLQNLYALRARGLLEANYCEADKKAIEKYIYNVENAISRLGKPYSRWSIISFEQSLKTLFKYLGNTEALAALEERKTKRPRKFLQKDKLITRKELNMLLRKMNPRNRAFFAILYDTGARIGEVGCLNVNDVRKVEHGYIIKIRHSKTQPREVYVAEMARPLRQYLANIEDYSDKEPLWKDTRGNRVRAAAWRAALKQAQLRSGISKKLYPHLFRHSRASELLRDTNLKTEFIKKRLGWALGSTTFEKTYLHLDQDDVHNAYLCSLNKGGVLK